MEVIVQVFLARSDFCCLLITFANSLDQDPRSGLTEYQELSGFKLFDSVPESMKKLIANCSDTLYSHI